MEKTSGMYCPWAVTFNISFEAPRFQQAEGLSNFQVWMKRGMLQFYKLGKDSSMFPSEQIVQTMGDSPIIRFQIAQLRDLVRKLIYLFNTVNEQ